MSNKSIELDIKNCTYHFCDDIINITNVDPNKITINEEKSYKNILIYYIG